MNEITKIKVFEDKNIRTSWNEEEEEWYFSISDIVEILADSKDPKQYIKKMKSRDKELNANWGTICTPIQMLGRDGKHRIIQAAKTRGILRLIQSIPSPKAEPFKLWLAQVGNDRLDEIADPEKAIMRGADYYRAKGYPENWINQQLQTIEMRKELTDEWKARGIDKEKDFAILTNDMTKAWSGLSVKEYKNLKGLTKENLRDNMTNLELVLNMLAEVTTTAISKSRQPETFAENQEIAIEGGSVAGDARKNIEKRIGTRVISPKNAKNKPSLEIKNTKLLKKDKK